MTLESQKLRDEFWNSMNAYSVTKPELSKLIEEVEAIGFKKGVDSVSKKD